MPIDFSKLSGANPANTARSCVACVRARSKAEPLDDGWGDPLGIAHRFIDLSLIHI